MEALIGILIPCYFVLMTLVHMALQYYNDTLNREYSVDVGRSLDQRLPLWISVMLNFAGIFVSCAFLIPNIPPFPAVSLKYRFAIAITLFLLSFSWYVLILLFRSPWSSVKKDVDYISGVIEHVSDPTERIVLLTRLANNRYGSGDIAGWERALRSLRTDTSRLLNNDKFRGARAEVAVHRALDAIQPLDD